MDRGYVFVIGAPRSGTTWLQNMMGAHPEIVTPQESNLFSVYVALLRREWSRSLPVSANEWQSARHNGLPAILTEEEFNLLIRDFVLSVYDAVRRLKPGRQSCAR